MYITRVTSRLAADTLSRARLRGITVFGEVMASSIGCSLREIRPSSSLIYYVTIPPIRSDPETPRTLLKALAV